MSVTHLVWDWNGTLLDDLAPSIAATNELLSRWSLPALTGVDAYRAIFRFPVVDYYLDLGFSADQFVPAAHDYGVLIREQASGYRLHEGATRTLDAVATRGIMQVVISAASQDDLDDQMAPFGIASHLDAVIGQRDIYARGKLDTARAWLDASEALPSDVLFVGDSTHDAEIADALGARCVLFTGGHMSSARLTEAGRPLIEGLDEVIDHLE